MSQQVKITRARVHGSAVYLGDITGADGTAAPVWSADPERVLSWLCDGFRFRFNQRRSTRCRYLSCEDRNGERVMVTDLVGEPVLVPIGRTVTDITDGQARKEYSFLAALPSLTLEATLKTEAMTGSRRQNAAIRMSLTGVNPGRCPGSAVRIAISGLCAGSTVAATRCSPRRVAGPAW